MLKPWRRLPFFLSVSFVFAYVNWTLFLHPRYHLRDVDCEEKQDDYKFRDDVIFLPKNETDKKLKLWYTRSGESREIVNRLISALGEPGRIERAENVTARIHKVIHSMGPAVIRRGPGQFLLPRLHGTQSPIVRWHQLIRRYHLYDTTTTYVDDVISDLRRRRFVDVEQTDASTTLVLIYNFDNGDRGVAKPMRYPREAETPPDNDYYSDFERHVAEIAAFHIDRLLGFGRVPPQTGRLVNVLTDIKALVNNRSKLYRTFHSSPVGNECFYGDCTFLCDFFHSICGNPMNLEISLAAYLPSRIDAHRTHRIHPWRRTYTMEAAAWEHNNNYCDGVRRREPFIQGPILLNLMDLAVFDFLLNNQDRHHYQTFTAFGNDTTLLHIDQGRGFGRSIHDDLSILAPVTQCCLIRRSTIQRLLSLHSDPMPASTKLRGMMATDPVAPILPEKHLLAVDRRIGKVLQQIDICLDKLPAEKVIVDDGL